MSIMIKGMEMPPCCAECWAMDDYGDYPRCRITGEQRGYMFPVTEQIMDSCPLSPAPEEKHGRWIPEDFGTGEFLLFDCSVCGRSQDGITRYCPCCGSKNGEAEEDGK